MPRTCEDVKGLLNGIFEYALQSGIIDRNPMAAVYIEKHERTPGKALNLDEEKYLLEKVKGSKIEPIVLICLYQGLRRCEIDSTEFNFEENTITVKNGKLKSYQKNLYRTIPIFPKLKPYLELFKSKVWKKGAGERQLLKFREIMPEHTLKDLRHTFTTRAKECLVSDEIVSIWTGHSLKTITSKVYTHYSIEFMQEQAKKVNY